MGKFRVEVRVLHVVGVSNKVQANSVGISVLMMVKDLIMLGRGRGVVILMVVIVMVDIVMDIVDVVMLRRVGDEVVVRVAIVGDQGAAMVVTCDLDLAGVDLVMIHHIGVSVHLDHGLSRRDCGSSKLGVSSISGLNVATGLVELNTVGARGLVVVGIVVVVVVVGIGVRLVMIVVILVGVLVLSEVVMSVPLRVRLVHVATVEGVVVVQLSLRAGENLSASGNHVGGEGELLAVKDESLSVVIEVVLGVLAVVLQVFNGLPHTGEVLDEGLHVLVGLFVVKTNLRVLVGNALIQLMDVMRQTANAVLKSLKSDE